ncbi:MULTISPECIES: type I restriction endonuclease subunit R [Actinotignum]|uniref:type I restriction endonuclease subunit R n=1 Tax=Actinotignum TaxID=1653174 RepID=UPI00254CE5A6|nr:type I restriction endonuclease subunit R [Actinotignum schaalii]MDE1536196.1 type I restriction endonuclease subunit R [Actinotignum schaalii]MDK7271002.1 type I restriction endonuclease subunit R [Actinotignum schaalii]MDY5130054.1 type I restriction endonuclease subunit R [Actinotignum timonense]
MTSYLPIAASDDATVVATYDPPTRQAAGYQSEAALEKELIAQLQRQEYEYLPIKEEADLENNLRAQLEALNGIRFDAEEWARFYSMQLANKAEGILEKTAIIQANPAALVLVRTDGSQKNIHLFDKENIHRNHMQVINQYEVEGRHHNRYDVTILVNGLPLVHIELKRRGVELREAFNQINRYQRDSFWAGSGLFQYVQLFVISNGTYTKYYSNTTRFEHVKGQNSGHKKASAASFEFTSWWTDARNRHITDLMDFAKTFLSKRTLLNIISRFCVFTSEKNLMVLRPYQIVAAERIINRIRIATNYKKLGSIEAGGYIWHTTGSGKTLTSFKTAQLATRIEGVDKVLFVVDRKDLDDQTKKEYETFQKGAVNSNRSTAELARQLSNPAARIVITTIQKLSNFVRATKTHDVYNSHIVIIFDECHRSQFGDMHKAITKAFRNYHLFGFTGTPIFNENKASGSSLAIRTTAQVFGDRLHSYTISDAITDANVLPFRIDYVNTVRAREGVEDEEVAAIATEAALLDPRRISQVVAYILEHFDQKTKRNEHYSLKGKRLSGFNSIFATASVNAAKLYYTEFARQQENLPVERRLKIATIFTYAANSDEYSGDGLLPEEDFNAEALSLPDREFLEGAIADYNTMFGSNFDTSANNFGNYYEDVSKKMKTRELDMLIVVNMFLTGFDAKTLNTLWVDKHMHHHGLLQAFSRTNRILNSVKTYGNIVSFRNLEKETNDAIALFGNKEAQGITVLKPFADYFSTYVTKIDALRTWEPGAVIASESQQNAFIQVFGELLRLRNILTAFDEFEGQDPLSQRDLQDYQSTYLELYRARRKQSEGDVERINDDLTFEIELMKHVEVNVDYILMLVERYRAQHEAGSRAEIREEIRRVVKSSPSLQNKLDLIERFIESVSVTGEIDQEWEQYLAEQKAVEIEQLVREENLKQPQTDTFIDMVFRRGRLVASGADIEIILPAESLFGAGKNSRIARKQRVIEKISLLLDRFRGLGAPATAESYAVADAGEYV